MNRAARRAAGVVVRLQEPRASNRDRDNPAAFIASGAAIVPIWLIWVFAGVGMTLAGFVTGFATGLWLG